MVTESGIIDGDFSSGESAMNKQVILVRHIISFLTYLLLGFLREKKNKACTMIQNSFNNSLKKSYKKRHKIVQIIF